MTSPRGNWFTTTYQWFLKAYLMWVTPGDAFARAVKLTPGSHVVAKTAKRSELHKFAVMPKRLVVERSFAWIEKCRRLWKNCERKLHNTLAMASLAFVSLILNRF